MKAHSDLTARGRAGRARRLVDRALPEYGLQGSRIRFLADEWNLQFRIDSPAGERYAMRVSDPDEHPPPHTMTEVEWLLQLGRETDLNLVQPVPRLDGKYLTPLADGSGTFINYVARASDDPEPFLTKATALLERYLAAG
jgi:hypothetical protein